METTVRDIILSITAIGAPCALIVYVARSIITQRYYMTERSITRNENIEAINRRIHGDHKRRQGA
jgi:hypothetical protein